jgi:hypothetical protein
VPAAAYEINIEVNSMQEQLQQQINEYNQFLKAIVRLHIEGIAEKDRARFIEWIFTNIGMLFMKYRVLGDPEKVLSAENFLGKMDN